MQTSGRKGCWKYESESIEQRKMIPFLEDRRAGNRKCINIHQYKNICDEEDEMSPHILIHQWSIQQENYKFIKIV
jgi:hypothetical protein